MFANYPRKTFSEFPTLQTLWDLVLSVWPDAILFATKRSTSPDSQDGGLDFLLAKDESNVEWMTATEAIWVISEDGWKVVIIQGMDASPTGFGMQVLEHLCGQTKVGSLLVSMRVRCTPV